MERSHTCWSCLHCGEAESGSLGKPKRAKCTITKRFGKLSRGYDCKHFEYKQRTKELGADGLPENSGRRVKAGETGVLMHSSRLSMRVYEYFLIDQTDFML